jgi:PAS domain S-box-containing protein
MGDPDGPTTGIGGNNAPSRRGLVSKWDDLRIRYKGIIIVAIPLVSLCLVILSDHYMERRTSEAASLLEHALDVRLVGRRLSVFAMDAETAVRGYVATGVPEFLDPWYDASEKAREEVDLLRQSLRGDAGQLRRVDKVEALLASHRKILGEMVEQVEEGKLGVERLQELMRSNKATMDLLRAELDQVAAIEVQRTDVYRAELAQLREYSHALTWFCLLVGLVGGGGAIYLFAEGVARRVIRLERNALLLGEGHPLIHGLNGADELGSLARALERAEDLLRVRDDAVKDSEYRLRSIIDNCPAVIFLKDLEGEYLLVNRYWEKLFDVKREDVVGKTDWELWPREVAAILRANDERVLSSDVPLAIEEEVPSGAGKRKYLSLKFVLRDRANVPYALCGVATDITERIESEERERRARHDADDARTEADRANRAKSEFLSRMSHELRTPLNSILGFAQVLQLDHMSDDQNESVAQILKAGRHLLALIDEVLDISRIEAGGLTLSPEPIHVTELLREVIGLVQPLAARHMVRVQPPAMDGDSRHVLADRQRLKQVLLNLLSNGIKYNKEGGTVRVTIERLDSGRIRLSVIDTGIGIDPAKLERLYVPFDRLGAEQSRVDGTGLGLALSKRLLEAMDSFIHVDSRPALGSTFAFELPEAEAPSMPGPLQPGIPPTPVPLGPAVKVLYIEDNLSNLRLMERLLQSRRPNIELLSAMQGRMGFDLARDTAPDLILLDLHLPDAHGDEVLRWLRAEPKTATIPVLVISADVTERHREQVLRGGANGYIAKPFDVPTLLRTLDEQLRKG